MERYIYTFLCMWKVKLWFSLTMPFCIYTTLHCIHSIFITYYAMRGLRGEGRVGGLYQLDRRAGEEL